ncbi:MAG: PilW family protein [Chromatiales bacterium]|nr:PilW family protein [Chromatiales bacterium]
MSSSVNISRQSGFTLIEMTLASALTVFLTLVMVMAYQANQQSSQYQTAINTMQNSARYVAQTMIERLTFADLAPGENDYVTVYGDNTELAATDSVTVEYTGDVLQGACVGKTVQLCDGVSASTLTPKLLPPTECVAVRATFSLAAGQYSGTSSLHCSSSQTAPPALGSEGWELVDEVEHLRVLYGVNTNGDGMNTVDQWMDWDEASANEPNIVALQIGYMLRSVNPIGVDTTDRVYNLLDIPLTKNDGRLRQVYSFTVALSGRIPPQTGP